MSLAIRTVQFKVLVIESANEMERPASPWRTIDRTIQGESVDVFLTRQKIKKLN
jgi:hypothetical protein